MKNVLKISLAVAALCVAANASAVVITSTTSLSSKPKLVQVSQGFEELIDFAFSKIKGPAA